MARFHHLKVIAIQKETEKAVSITFDVPDDLKDTFAFKAGQYITLKTEIDGEEIRRDYSLCTNPANGILKVVVKEVSGGQFSSFANNRLKVGDRIEVGPPLGRFVLEPEKDASRTIVAFAAGSGITPVMSILNTVLDEEPQSNFVLVYGNKTPEDTIFLKPLEELNSDEEDRFLLTLIYSQTNETNALFGRIDSSIVNYILNQIDNQDDIDAFYLCGPEDMINTVRSTLMEKGFDQSKIRYELFTVSTDTGDVATNDTHEGESTVTVIVDDEASTFNMPSDKTILEVALENDIDAPFSCQGGICSTCIARLKEGEVIMRQNNILTDSEIEEGLILTCQSQPTTTKITVDYDDV